MPPNKRYKRRRDRLVKEYPFCYWCGKPVKLYPPLKPHQKPPLDQATIDHLRTRYNPDRQIPSPDKEQTVLSCWECNHKRGSEDTQNTPIDELHRRSRHAESVV
jgi:5-methylcytosine-specific restriction endonuclease McrA